MTDWTKIPPINKYVATDLDGDIHAFETMPYLHHGNWQKGGLRMTLHSEMDGNHVKNYRETLERKPI